MWAPWCWVGRQDNLNLNFNPRVRNLILKIIWFQLELQFTTIPSTVPSHLSENPIPIQSKILCFFTIVSYLSPINVSLLLPQSHLSKSYALSSVDPNLAPGFGSPYPAAPSACGHTKPENLICPTFSVDSYVAIMLVCSRDKYFFKNNIWYGKIYDTWYNFILIKYII